MKVVLVYLCATFTTLLLVLAILFLSLVRSPSKVLFVKLQPKERVESKIYLNLLVSNQSIFISMY